MKPVLLMIAGPNGSGKTKVTVLLRRNQSSENVECINPDDIAKEKFGDWNSRDAILDVANWAEARREELFDQRAGIKKRGFDGIVVFVFSGHGDSLTVWKL